MTGVHSGGGWWAGGCWVLRTLTKIWPTANEGFGWAGAGERAVLSPAAYERSDLDLTPAGRGSPLTSFSFPNSLPLRVNFIRPTVSLSVWVA